MLNVRPASIDEQAATRNFRRPARLQRGAQYRAARGAARRSARAARALRDHLRQRQFGGRHAGEDQGAFRARPARALRVVRPQFRPHGGAARRPASCARRRRRADGLRFRAPAGSAADACRRMETRHQGGADQAAAGPDAVGAQARHLTLVLQAAERDRRRRNRAGQRRLPAARPRGGGAHQRLRGPRHLPARPGALVRLSDRDHSVRAGSSRRRRIEIFADQDDRSRGDGRGRAQRQAAAHRHPSFARLRRGRSLAAGLLVHQLPSGQAHGCRLDVDHVRDRHSRRRPIPGARHHGRISRPACAREPRLADLYRCRDRRHARGGAHAQAA